MLEPNRDQIEMFVDAIFRHAQGGFVSLRAFVEGSNDVFRKTPIKIVSNNLSHLCDAVEDDARRAAQHPRAVVFAPPLATFANGQSATERDVVEGYTVSVEVDEHPDAARAKLETILGPATTVIRSGGVWNDGNGGAQDKLHLHWRLTRPARERDDLVKLKRVREICARLVGADPTSIPVSHPIRWPGSWHRKAQPRLTEIVACDPDIEIELADALARLEPLAPTPPPTDNRAAQPGGEWDTLTGNILAGKNLHTTIARLAMKMLRGGTPEIMAVQMLRGMMDAAQAPHDDRWRDRYADIPRAVSSAGRKLAAEKEAAEEETAAAAAPPLFPPPPPPSSPATGPAPSAAPGPTPSSPIEDTLQTFERWLYLSNRRPLYAMLGTVAANLLPGDPVWLGLVAPPSSAKTELLNALTGLPFVVSVSTLTLASLLSGTPKRQQAAGAKGGLLRQVGNPGLLCLKDFTSTLTMRPENKPEVLSALREIYDGKWTRYVGTDGGRVLHWEGKLGLVFGCTGAIDTQHSVGDALGNRFLLMRLGTGENQFAWALKHTGVSIGTMRRELVASVTQLFNASRSAPRPLDKESSEFRRLNRVINLVVRLRGATERDRYSRRVWRRRHRRIGLALERLLAGLDTLGVNRKIALGVVMRIALDSTPPVRRRIYEMLRKPPPGAGRSAPLPKWTTTEVGNRLGLPTTTARRNLADLASYGLVKEEGQGAGKPSLWQAIVLP
jgi:hypothetical protein